MEIIKLEEVNEKIIVIRNENVILDRDVAELYGVETKRINEAVKNNPDKFPEGYIFSLQNAEKQQLVENFDRFKNIKHSINTTAFSEKGLYMLATILKSEKATKTTLAIVEAFAQLRELSRAVAQTVAEPTDENQKILAEKSGTLISDLLGDNLRATEAETTIELNLALLKVKHTVKRKVNK